MPVTAKLSRKFYDRLGDDVASELVDWFNQVDETYKAELRQLNELNFARFDAKLEQRLAELRSELRGEISALRVELLSALNVRTAELRREMSEMKAGLMRWLFGLWATQVIALIGVVLTVLITR